VSEGSEFPHAENATCTSVSTASWSAGVVGRTITGIGQCSRTSRAASRTRLAGSGARRFGSLASMSADRTGAGYCAPMAEIRAEITANVWQVIAEEGQMVAEGDEICILESMKMEIPVITEVPGVVRELHVEPEQVVQEGDLIALIDES
jgi:biotin carboxyl carrier protein